MNTTPEQVAVLVRKMLKAGFAFESIEDVKAASHTAPGAFCTAAAAAINREAGAGDGHAAEIIDRRAEGDGGWADLWVGDDGALSIVAVSGSWEDESPARVADLFAVAE